MFIIIIMAPAGKLFKGGGPLPGPRGGGGSADPGSGSGWSFAASTSFSFGPPLAMPSS
jgi:hypothetical protein